MAMSDTGAINQYGHRHNRELVSLWIRRDELDEAEWTQLYTIVWEILFPYNVSILQKLPDGKEIYVNEFFQDKVFRPELKSHIDHAGALRVAYQRYLIDVYRAQPRRPIAGEGTEPDEFSEGNTNGVTSSNADVDAPQSDETILYETTGKTVAQIADLADQWLTETTESWVPIYLGLNYCPDAIDSAPLYKLARKYQIANYHRKAEQLGISGPQIDGFSETLIGRWLTQQVKLEVVPQNQPAIAAALKILCLQALLWAEDQEKAL